LYREKTLFWGTVGSFAISFLLLLVAGTLISTGRHKLRAEVDAGVTVGVVASLFTACSALGMTLYRNDQLSLPHLLAVWATFIASCTLNGMLLVLVVGNTP
jgi:ABC-type transport system involved in multi-copper enzyme maturation permease subunit